MSELVKIVIPKIEDGGPLPALGTKVFIGGDEVKDITALDVRFRPDETVVAEITLFDRVASGFPVGEVPDIWALPFMSEESFFQAAKRYGYEVEKKKP